MIAVVLDRADDANDAAGCGLASDAQHLPERISREARCEDIVDDRHRLSVAPIAGVELASRPNRDAKRREVVWTDDVVARLQRIWRSRNREAFRGAHCGNRRVPAECHCLHPRTPSEVLLEPLVQCTARVSRVSLIEEHHTAENGVRRIESDIDAGDAPCASRQERSGCQHHAAQSHLRDNEHAVRARARREREC